MVGPVCESGDFLALDRSLPEPKPGDLLAVMTAGAYGAVQSGTYNTRPLVPEVLVRQDEWALVRPRVDGRGADRAGPPAAVALSWRLCSGSDLAFAVCALGGVATQSAMNPPSCYLC